jgi:hypothetical protein
MAFREVHVIEVIEAFRLWMRGREVFEQLPSQVRLTGKRFAGTSKPLRSADLSVTVAKNNSAMS